MEIHEIVGDDGIRISAFFSKDRMTDTVVIHTHGFGGDALSNNFVRKMHTAFPAQGYDFVSYNGRMSGYLIEQYTETSVKYVGSSVINYHEDLLDISAIIKHYSKEYKNVVLQGHSFGTNIVKALVDHTAISNALIFLSPADSMMLNTSWLKKNTPSNESIQGSPEIRWDLFGIVTDGQSYSIPITQESYSSLLKSRSFNAWSGEIQNINNRSLVVFGDSDQISNFGNTGDYVLLPGKMPNVKVHRIANAGHLFLNKETLLLECILDYLRTIIP